MLISAFPMPAGRAWAVAGLLGGVTTLALEPVRSNFDYGQINVILMVMVVSDLTWVRTVGGRGTGRAGGRHQAHAPHLSRLLRRGQGVAPAARERGTFIVVTAVSWAVLPRTPTSTGSTRSTTPSAPVRWASRATNRGTACSTVPPFDGGHLGTAMWAAVAGHAGRRHRPHPTGWSQGFVPPRRSCVLALTEVLVSPVSWTHHWSWLALAPIVAVSVARVHRSVAAALMVLVALGVFAPYLWVPSPPLADLASNSLVLGAAVVLAVWLVAEVPAGLRPERPRSPVGLETSGEPRPGPVA
jgi:alpha-1,2-mannosyltransferase